MSSQSRILLAALALSAAAPAARAQLAVSDVSIHGYGAWTGGKTDHNRFLGSDSLGNYSAASMALNFQALVTEKSRVMMQVSLENSDVGEHVELDYGFVDYATEHGLHIRAGQVKQPFGLYNEIYHVGVLRPALFLPQSVYGDNGTRGESFRGVGLSASATRAGWATDWDLYAGGLQLADDDRGAAFAKGDSSAFLVEADELFERNVVGGRVRVATPIEGLSIGTSLWRGDFYDGTTRETRRVAGGQLEYARDRFTLRHEIVRVLEGDDFQSLGGYGELSFDVVEHWQLHGRVDRIYETVTGATSPRPSLLQHRDISAGVNYIVTSSLVFRAELHDIVGNQYARPTDEAIADALATGAAISSKTRALMLGAQFSF